MTFVWSPKATEQFGSFPYDAQRRISEKMRFYAAQKEPLRFAKRLRGSDLCRFRIGDYRILFEVQNKNLYILAILKRDDAYCNL